MTGDARGEAERIVDRMELELSWLSDEYDVQRDRLVAALAAAIEVAHKRDASGTYDADPDCCEECNLILAIGALRARAGEDDDGR